MLVSSQVTFILIMVLLAYAVALPLRVGMFSVAPVAFAGIGAYTSALIVMKLGVPIVVGIAVATVGCGLAGAVLAFPLLRIRGLFTAVATLAFVVIATGVETGLGITGGENGLIDVPSANLRVELIAVVVVLVAVWWWIDHSQTGRRLDVAAHDVALASTLGIVVMRYRFACLVASAAIGGFAGALYAHSFYFLVPDNFNIYFTIDVAAYAIVGGTNYWLGPLIGAGVLAYLTEILNGIPNWANIILGVIMVVVVVVYPSGVGGGLRRMFRYRGAVRRAGGSRPKGGAHRLTSDRDFDEAESYSPPVKESSVKP
jgi:branched-chain amino acid transport system permease protein